MTVWSLEPVDITKSCFLPYDLPGLTGTCLSIFLPSVLSSVTEKLICWGWDQVADVAIEVDLFAFKNSWVAFTVCFGSLFINVKQHAFSFATFASSEPRVYTLSVHFRIHHANSVSCEIINTIEPLSHNTASAMLDRWSCVRWIIPGFFRYKWNLAWFPDFCNRLFLFHKGEDLFYHNWIIII